jgi:tRNA-dihydrouridine synthase B
VSADSALLQQLKENPFVLAPMAGITDNAFRSFMKEMGTSIVITELVSAHGIEYRGANTLKLMKFNDFQRPIGIQLFGETPEIVAKAAKFSQDEGCTFVDLNFGCPVPKVVNKGAGSAILKDPLRVRDMLRHVKSAIQIPLTIKIRTGWDLPSRNAGEICQIAFDEGVSWVAIHGRTRAQAYTGLADWDYIAEVKSKAKVPIIGNGDILTAHQAVERLTTTGVDGVMIGRGCLKNPWIFLESFARLREPSKPLVLEKSFNQVLLSLQRHLEAECDERLLMIQLKKFASWFSSGYPNASLLRKSLFQSNSLAELKAIMDDYFISLDRVQQADTSSEAFLMGGHG